MSFAGDIVCKCSSISVNKLIELCHGLQRDDANSSALMQIQKSIDLDQVNLILLSNFYDSEHCNVILSPL